jgi:hypothetical protein
MAGDIYLIEKKLNLKFFSLIRRVILSAVFSKILISDHYLIEKLY